VYESTVTAITIASLELTAVFSAETNEVPWTKASAHSAVWEYVRYSSRKPNSI